MKRYKQIIIGALIIATTTVGATAYANKGEGGFQQRIMDRISKKLDLTDTQVSALDVLAMELQETRQLMKGDSGDVRAKMSDLITAGTFDQGKALEMVYERVDGIRDNAPELVAAAAVFFDGLDAEQKEQISKFASKKRRGHRH